MLTGYDLEGYIPQCLAIDRRALSQWSLLKSRPVVSSSVPYISQDSKDFDEKSHHYLVLLSKVCKEVLVSRAGLTGSKPSVGGQIQLGLAEQNAILRREAVCGNAAKPLQRHRTHRSTDCQKTTCSAVAGACKLCLGGGDMYSQYRGRGRDIRRRQMRTKCKYKLK